MSFFSKFETKFGNTYVYMLIPWGALILLIFVNAHDNNYNETMTVKTIAATSLPI